MKKMTTKKSAINLMQAKSKALVSTLSNVTAEVMLQRYGCLISIR